MPKHNFAETTSVNHKVFFEGDAEVSDEDLKALKEAKSNKNEATENTNENESGEEINQKETKNQKGK